MPVLNGAAENRRRQRDVVPRHFSERSLYWRLVYEPDAQGPSPCARAAVQRRRDLVLAAIDHYCESRCGRILDAGCGAGVITGALAARGHRVVAVDAAEGMLRTAAASLETWVRAGAVVLCQEDVSALCFGDASFDAVVCVGVLEYVPDLDRTITELLRVLRPGGILIVTFPNLLKLAHVLDPYYYIVRIPAFIRARWMRSREPEGTVHHPSEIVQNLDLRCRRFTLGNIERRFRARGCAPRARSNVFFGPLTFWRRGLAGTAGAQALDDTLRALSARRGLRWLGALADRWVFVFQKREA